MFFKIPIIIMDRCRDVLKMSIELNPRMPGWNNNGQATPSPLYSHLWRLQICHNLLLRLESNLMTVVCSMTWKIFRHSHLQTIWRGNSLRHEKSREWVLSITWFNILRIQGCTKITFLSSLNMRKNNFLLPARESNFLLFIHWTWEGYLSPSLSR